MTREELELMRQLIDKLNRVERRLAVLETGESGGGGAVDSVNGETGTVVLDADDIDDATTAHKFATAAQLADIATAVQPGDLATVATSGDYDDLIDTPSIPATFDDLSDGTTNKAFTSTEKGKLSGIATGANNYSHPNHTGDVTSSGDGATTIASGVVSNAKLANMAQATIKGRAAAAGTGAPTDLSASDVRTLIGVANGADVTSTALDAAAADTPDNAHKFVYVAVAALKSITWANIKATLKTYFDTLYAPKAAVAARAYNNAAISAGDSGYTVLTLNSEDYDTDSIHSTSSNTSRLTAPAAGKYLLTGNAVFASNGTGIRIMAIRKNGTGTDLAVTVLPAVSGGATTVLDVTTVLALSVNDYVELFVWQNSGGSLNVLANTPVFTMTKIGT